MTPTLRPQMMNHGMANGPRNPAMGGPAMMAAIRQRRMQAQQGQPNGPGAPGMLAAPRPGGGGAMADPYAGAVQESPASNLYNGGALPPGIPNGGSQALQSTQAVGPAMAGGYAAAAMQVGAAPTPGGPSTPPPPVSAQNPWGGAAGTMAGLPPQQGGATPLRGQPGGPPAYSATNLGPGQTAAMYAPGGIFDPAMTANMPPQQALGASSHTAPPAPATATTQPAPAPPRAASAPAPTPAPSTMTTPGLPQRTGGQAMAPAPTTPAPGSSLGAVAPVSQLRRGGAPAATTAQPTAPPPGGAGFSVGKTISNQPMKMARGGIVPHVRSAHHMRIPHRGLPMAPPPPSGPPSGPGGQMDDGTQMYASGGIPNSPAVLANPIPMARLMSRYRSQGGPMSKISNPMTAASFPSGMAKAGAKRFPMPKSEHGSMTSLAHR